MFCKKLKKDCISIPLITQIIKSSTSVGANYREANCASSKKDFRNKISIAKKECNETEHWFDMLSECFPEKTEELKILWKENNELTRIFAKITSTLDKKV